MKVLENMIILLVFVLVVLSFIAGQRWESFVIAEELKEKGQVTRKWGDTAKVKIIGTAKDL